MGETAPHNVIAFKQGIYLEPRTDAHRDNPESRRDARVLFTSFGFKEHGLQAPRGDLVS